MMYRPSDALRLLRDKGLVDYACDPTRNPSWARADARTRDAHGKRVLDHLEDWQGEEIVAEVQRLLALPPAMLERHLRDEPVRRTEILNRKKARGRPRIVAIPTYLRRCLGLVLCRVLTLTCAGLYTPIARAYRPGLHQPVVQAIREVSRAVADGKVRFWAKLDFKSFFDRVPRWFIEQTLRRLGYPESFAQTTMTLVRCRVVAVRGERWDDHDVQEGVQQGLAESAVLANLVAHELDEQLLALGPDLVAIRYSDDIFLGAPNKGLVRKAVNLVRAWAARLGIHLKDERPDVPTGGVVAMNMALNKLVFDVRERPILLLGAQIDHLGRVQVPKKKLRDKVALLKKLAESLRQEGVIEGTSCYGNGRGVAAHDQDDLDQQIEGFLTYWRNLLDEGAAQRLERYLRNEFPTPEGVTSRAVWVASLWGQQTDGTAVYGPTGASTMEVSSSQGRMGRSVHLNTGASTPPAEVGPLTGHGQGGRWAVAAEGIPQPAEETPGSEPAEEAQGEGRAVRRDPSPGEHSGAASPYSDEGKRTDARRKAEPERAEAGSWHGLETEAGCKPCRGHREVEESKVEPEDTSDGSSSDSTRFPSGLSSGDVSQLLREIDGEIEPDDVSLGEPPLQELIENNEVLYVITKRGPDGTCWVGTIMTFKGKVTRSPSVVCRSGRPEALVLLAILEHLERQVGPLVVALPEAELPKALLQRHRRYHAHRYYGLVLRLHWAARRRGLDVRIVGPLQPPAALTRALEDAEDAALRRATSRSH